MKDYADLVHLIAPEVPGCPDVLIEKTLLDVVRTFCLKTQCFKRVLANVVPIDGTAEYTLVPTEGFEVTSLARVWVNGKRLFPLVRKPAKPTSGHNPSHYYEPYPGQLGLHPTPNALSTLEVEVEAFLRPTLASTGTDELIVERYEDDIVHGVLGKLMSMSKKPWTDLPMSDFHMRSFRRGSSVALLESVRGGTNATYTAYPEIV
jgi:hypothetical protein